MDAKRPEPRDIVSIMPYVAAEYVAELQQQLNRAERERDEAIATARLAVWILILTWLGFFWIEVILAVVK